MLNQQLRLLINTIQLNINYIGKIVLFEMGV